MNSTVLKTLTLARVIGLCIHASGCTHMAEPPMIDMPRGETSAGYVSPAFGEPAQTPQFAEARSPFATASLPRTRSVWWSRAEPRAETEVLTPAEPLTWGDRLTKATYGTLRGVGFGLQTACGLPLGPLNLIVSVPVGAVAGLIGGMMSPSVGAVGEWDLGEGSCGGGTSASYEAPHAERRPVVLVTNPAPAIAAPAASHARSSRQEAPKPRPSSSHSPKPERQHREPARSTPMHHTAPKPVVHRAEHRPAPSKPAGHKSSSKPERKKK